MTCEHCSQSAPARKQRNERRLVQVREALANGRGFGSLATRWNMTVPSVLLWSKRHLSEADLAKLGENGRTARHIGPDRPDTVSRLEMVAMCRAAGWSDLRIARGMGISQPALCNWLKRHAPDGIEDALVDLEDDELNWPSRTLQQPDAADAA